MKNKILFFLFCILSIPAHAGMEKYEGSFRGPLISNGTREVVTTLKTIGNDLVGEYVMHYNDPNTPPEKGYIGPCTPRAKQEILCVWQDKFGIGAASFLFDKKYQQFKGTWLPFSENGIGGFPKMNKNSQSSWDGVKFNPQEGM